MKNANSWFDIPVTDIARATRFYETLLAAQLNRAEELRGIKIAIFPHERGSGAGGCLRQSGTPGGGGTMVYLDVRGQLDACIARVEKAGGALLVPKTDIGPAGFFAVIRDTEGNEVGLHTER
jgi:predicted enzyme related to lactoylglutathione lyase